MSERLDCAIFKLSTLQPRDMCTRSIFKLPDYANNELYVIDFVKGNTIY